MGKVFEGNYLGQGLKIGIVVGRFNEFITSKLLSGAIDALVRHGVKEADIDQVWVPGSYEVPLAAKKVAASKKYDAVITLAAVIRGATPHFDFVSSEIAKGVAAASMQTEVPIIFGVLTTDTLEQAIERAGTKGGNKGWDAGISAIEMANLFKELK